ncbi:hypothetical protein IFR05_008175 [Cadophora sp. M221]|nr:hypothetical protein IFR05_008175 [Cadophora sp. M221]
MENRQNGPSPPRYPRVTIEFCTQCKWLLRAAYVALQPSTGGTFIVNLQTESPSEAQGFPVMVNQHILWDRKAEGGFPETKELKRRVRDIIDPKRDLGHVDGKKNTSTNPEPSTTTSTNPSSQEPTPQNTSGTNTPIPRAINRLHAAVSGDERKFTPMDISSFLDLTRCPVVDGMIMNMILDIAILQLLYGMDTFTSSRFDYL